MIRGLLFVLVALLACSGEDHKSSSPLYYNLNGLIEQQVHLLDSLDAAVDKEMTINQSSQNQSLRKIDWEKELSVFKEGDINSPILRETFKIEKEIINKHTTLTYTPLKVKSKGVMKLIVTFQEYDDPVKIFCLLKTKNILFYSERKLLLEFIKKGNTNFLNKYSIGSTQKVIFKYQINTFIKGTPIFSF